MSSMSIWHPLNCCCCCDGGVIPIDPDAILDENSIDILDENSAAILDENG